MNILKLFCLRTGQCGIHYADGCRFISEIEHGNYFRVIFRLTGLGLHHALIKSLLWFLNLLRFLPRLKANIFLLRFLLFFSLLFVLTIVKHVAILPPNVCLILDIELLQKYENFHQCCLLWVLHFRKIGGNLKALNIDFEVLFNSVFLIHFLCLIFCYRCHIE